MYTYMGKTTHSPKGPFYIETATTLLQPFRSRLLWEGKCVGRIVLIRWTPAHVADVHVSIFTMFPWLLLHHLCRPRSFYPPFNEPRQPNSMARTRDTGESLVWRVLS
jgi:hypothetical protein